MEDMPKLKNYDVPVYTMIRDPYDYVLSRYSHKCMSEDRKKNCPPEEWVERYDEECHKDEFGSVMVKYRDYVDDFFIFSDGLESFFAAVGFPDVEMETLGMDERIKKVKLSDVSADCKAMMDERFADELALYERVIQRHHNGS
jgi:hypothetical protein